MRSVTAGAGLRRGRKRELVQPLVFLLLLVPTRHAESFIGGTLAELDPADVGQRPIAIYPYLRDRFEAPNFRVPDGETFFLLGLLRNAIPPTPERSAELIAANRRLYEQVRALGGYHYPIDSVPKTQADWRRHFGRRWNQFAAIKRAQDPDLILTPGQNIFPVLQETDIAVLNRSQPWKSGELEILGTAPNDEIACWLHRTVRPMRSKRQKLGLAVCRRR